MRWLVRAIAIIALLVVMPSTVFDAMGEESVCYGTTANGSLSGGVRPPLYGENFRVYCVACALALRTYGHAPAIEALVDSFARVAPDLPSTTFVYGEIGFPWGGPFRPHRTHQNGLSIDVMVPLTDGGTLPTSATNRFGYDEEFDSDGNGTAGRIDFDAIAAHLLALDDAARDRGGRIGRVFFAPDLQDDLFRTPAGAVLRRRVQFNARQSWVRHDDHYHVDLAFACR